MAKNKLAKKAPKLKKKKGNIIKRNLSAKAKSKSSSSDNPFLQGFVVPGLPHPLLAPEKNAGWQRLRDAYDKVAREIEELKPDVICIYSTYWPSVIGHQIQADPNAEWTLVDDQFHFLGSIPYSLKFDAKLAEAYAKNCNERGLHTRTVAYKGFPIDTGSVVALKLLNPANKVPAIIVSSNIYADRAETVVLGKALRETLQASGKKAVALIVTSLSNRLLPLDIDPKNDRIHSLKDQEWNKKLLELLEDGRLEDVAQLSRQVHREARVNKVNNFKPFWWLSAAMGPNNFYKGEVYAYEAVHGTGAALVGLTPSNVKSRDLEFDEDSPSRFAGERNVLD